MKQIKKNATFNKRQLSNIRRARTLLAMADYKSCYDNRDTQILEEAIKKIDKVIEYQLKQTLNK